MGLRHAVYKVDDAHIPAPMSREMGFRVAGKSLKQGSSTAATRSRPVPPPRVAVDIVATMI